MNGAQQEKNEARPVKALIHGNRAKILPRGSDGPYGALVVRTSTGDAGGKVSVLRKLPDDFDTQRLIGAATPAISQIGVSFFRQQSSQKGNRQEQVKPTVKTGKMPMVIYRCKTYKRPPTIEKLVKHFPFTAMHRCRCSGAIC